jgi:hypothetical protein
MRNHAMRVSSCCPQLEQNMGAGLDTLLTFCGERVRGFGDDDPGDDVSEESGACEEDTEYPENAD